jgi:hypothetical protein
VGDVRAFAQTPECSKITDVLVENILAIAHPLHAVFSQFKIIVMKFEAVTWGLMGEVHVGIPAFRRVLCEQQTPRFRDAFAAGIAKLDYLLAQYDQNIAPWKVVTCWLSYIWKDETFCYAS